MIAHMIHKEASNDPAMRDLIMSLSQHGLCSTITKEEMQRKSKLIGAEPEKWGVSWRLRATLAGMEVIDARYNSQNGDVKKAAAWFLTAAEKVLNSHQFMAWETGGPK